MDEVVDLSNDLLNFMEEDGVPVTLGAASAALTVGRLITSKKMSYEKGAEFINALMNFTQTYFTEGTIH